MVKELNENDLGLMVGKFYSDVFGYDIEVMYEKGISQEYVERNIEYFNNLDQNFIINMEGVLFQLLLINIAILVHATFRVFLTIQISLHILR